MIALSIIFDRRSPHASESGTIAEAAAGAIRAFGPRRREEISRRAAWLDSLSRIERQRWLFGWANHIGRRGLTMKLDPHINADHVARVLKNEPIAIRRVVLNYLPPDLGDGSARLMQTRLGVGPFDGEVTKDPPAEVVDAVKRRFLANFVQFESIGDPNPIDEMSGGRLYRFVEFLGQREIAVACRGISSREKVAAFLCRFSEGDAKSIAAYLSELHDVEPVWVSIADRTVQRAWNRRLRPHQILHKIGLKMLACVFAERSGTAVRYTAQKLSSRDAARWTKMIAAWRERLEDPDAGMVEMERKRAAMIVSMAGTWKEEGSL